MVTCGTVSVTTIPCLPYATIPTTATGVFPPPPQPAPGSITCTGYLPAFPVVPPPPMPCLSVLLPTPPPSAPSSPLCSPLPMSPTCVTYTTSPSSPMTPCPMMGYLNCLVVVPSRKKQSYGMEAIWLEEFNKLFDSLPNPWRLISAEQPPTGGNIVYNYNDSAKVRFCCEICGHGWTSMKGRVAFFFDVTMPGLVIYTLYGQQCQKCESQDYQNPMWYPEEVNKVLTNLYNEVGKIFYGFYSKPREKNRRVGKPRTPHNGNLCQACKDGICSR